MGKVLIVDDTKNIRLLLTTCLELRGYDVITAENGKVAIGILQKEKNNIDLIFLDVRMPGMSGTEVLRSFSNYGMEYKVIIMTAFATVKNAVECTKLGATLYLQKPFSHERVNSILDEIEMGKNNVKKISCEKEDDLQVYITKAEKLINEQKYNEAIDTLKKALAISPYVKHIYYLISKANEGIGNNIQATRFNTISELFN